MSKAGERILRSVRSAQAFCRSEELDGSTVHLSNDVSDGMGQKVQPLEVDTVDDFCEPYRVRVWR